MNTANHSACMEVVCISARTSLPNQIEVGKKYLIDRTTIWLDSDGDAYGTAYEFEGRRPVGQLALKHFMSIGSLVAAVNRG